MFCIQPIREEFTGRVQWYSLFIPPNLFRSNQELTTTKLNCQNFIKRWVSIYVTFTTHQNKIYFEGINIYLYFFHYTLRDQDYLWSLITCRFLQGVFKGAVHKIYMGVRETVSSTGIQFTFNVFFHRFDPFGHYGRFNGVTGRSKMVHQL